MTAVKRKYVQLAEIATIAGVSKRTILQWEKDYPDFPARYKINRTILFSAAAIDAWFESRIVSPERENKQ